MSAPAGFFDIAVLCKLDTAETRPTSNAQDFIMQIVESCFTMLFVTPGWKLESFVTSFSSWNFRQTSTAEESMRNDDEGGGTVHRRPRDRRPEPVRARHGTGLHPLRSIAATEQLPNAAPAD